MTWVAYGAPGPRTAVAASDDAENRERFGHVGV